MGRLRWGLATDSHDFKQPLAEERWSQAVQLYQGNTYVKARDQYVCEGGNGGVS